MARQPRRLDREIETNFGKKGKRRATMPTWDEIVAQTSEGGSPIIPGRGELRRVQRDIVENYDHRGGRRARVPDWQQIERESRSGTPAALDDDVFPTGDDIGFGPAIRERRRQYKKQRPHPMREFEGTPQTREQIKEARRTGDYSGLLDYTVTNTSNPPRPRAIRAGYDPESRQLRVVFRDSDVYVYHDVEPEIWRALKSADSFGKTLERLVVHNKEYEWEGRIFSGARSTRVQYWDQRRWNAMDTTVEQASWDDFGR